MAPFTRNVSFHSINLSEMLQYDLVKTSSIFQSAMELIHQGISKPIHPVASHPFSRIEEAFGLMQSGNHMGKIVLEPTETDIVSVIASLSKAVEFRSDATYVLSGGSGGIGRSLAQWMFENGAKNIVFLSRSGMSKPEMKELVEKLTKEGANATAYSCDVADKDQVQAALALCATEFPPIRGVIQGAMVLQVCLPTLSNSSDN